MATWTVGKNAICFIELKDYINYLSTLSVGEVNRGKEAYVSRLMEIYPLLKEHGTTEAVIQHLDYLYALAMGEIKTSTEKDQCYFGILSNPTEYVNECGAEELIEEHEFVDGEDETNLDIETLDDSISLTGEHRDSLLSFIGHGHLGNKYCFF
ncbi:hypothetical protein [Psychrobacillus sp. L4]|uniref:hypothetical protein n=1 Tax=Psychrobacillus sp. L4 TaxID=3236892 RepID=UPI0036F22110